MARPTGIAIGILMFCGLGLTGCPPVANQTPPPIGVGSDLEAEFVVNGASQPAGLAFSSDGRVFYTEKSTGRIRVIQGGVLQADPAAAVPVNSAGERGLLGIALHPDFDRNGRMYVFYARSDLGESTSDARAIVDYRVVYFELSGNAAVGGEVFVASLPVSSVTDRVGGRIIFDATGRLLVGIGDQGDSDAAQNPVLLAGKVLRYGDDGSIPADNPRAGSPVYCVGVRDPHGLALDPVAGSVYLLDRNADGHEELNRVVVNANYGWPAVVGRADTDAERSFAAGEPAYLDPVYESDNAVVGLVGGGFNPSGRYGPHTANELFYAEAARDRIIRLELDEARANVTSREVFAAGFPSAILDTAFTPAGTLYVACEDVVLRLVPTR